MAVKKILVICVDCKKEFMREIYRCIENKIVRCKRCATINFNKNRIWTKEMRQAKGKISNNMGFRLPKGEVGLNELYGSYKHNAKGRNLSFNISKEEFKFLTEKNCSYCNAQPTNKIKARHINGTYIYNGLDRVDNSKGYEIDNVVPCCKHCNMMKKTMSKQDFISQVKNIYNHSLSYEIGKRMIYNTMF